jgi:arginyl-tRNA--protein-N-Asp/Glu arginylyltransferase
MKRKRIKKLVYKIPCMNCNKCYIGETRREKSTRMKEHQKGIKKMSDSSNIVKHITEHKHSFNFNQTETLSYENNWKRRIIKESLYTH